MDIDEVGSSGSRKELVNSGISIPTLSLRGIALDPPHILKDYIKGTARRCRALCYDSSLPSYEDRGGRGAGWARLFTRLLSLGSPVSQYVVFDGIVLPPQ